MNSSIGWIEWPMVKTVPEGQDSGSEGGTAMGLERDMLLEMVAAAPPGKPPLECLVETTGQRE